MEQDARLAEIWEWAKLENLDLARRFGLSEAADFYEDVGKSGRNTDNLADRFAIVRWKFIEKMKEDPAFAREYRKLVLEIRGKVGEIGKSESSII
jgi:hypothetical protein